jgi:hypothetical protein
MTFVEFGDAGGRGEPEPATHPAPRATEFHEGHWRASRICQAS